MPTDNHARPEHPEAVMPAQKPGRVTDQRMAPGQAGSLDAILRSADGSGQSMLYVSPSYFRRIREVQAWMRDLSANPQLTAESAAHPASGQVLYRSCEAVSTHFSGNILITVER